MNKRRLLFILAALIGIAGLVLSVIMFISAIRFYEIGRVILYFMLAAVCAELTILSFIKAIHNDEPQG